MTDRKRWFGLPFVAMGVALIIIDATIVNVAIPSIIDDLGVTATQTQWIQESYTLIFASLLLVFGRLADRYGRKLMFITGVLIFAAASVVAANSGSGDALIAARWLQGFGGAMMLPTSLSLLNSTFFGKDRGIAFAVWGSTIGAAAAFGPLLGGWLTTSYSWRWAFGINIPLGLIVIAGVWLLFAESRPEAGKVGADFVGAAFSIVGIGSIVYALIEGRTYGWWSALSQPSILGFDWTWSISIAPIAMLFGLLVLVLFVWVELRRNRAGLPALLDMRLLGIRSFRNANISAAIVSLGEFGLLFALPLWLQNVLGYSAFDTGLLLLPLAAGSFLASGVGAPLGNKIGPIAIVRAGILLEMIGIAIAGFVISPSTQWWLVGIPLFIYGAGVGLATAQLTGVALADVPVENSGQASGITSTSRQLGSALGIAVLGTTLFTTLGSDLESRLAGVQGLPVEQQKALTDAVTSSAGAVIPQFQQTPALEAVAQAAGEALSQGTRVAAFVGAAFLLIGWFASMSLGKSKPVESVSE